MLKFIKSHMSTIDGVEVFPLISFIIFFVFFVGLTVYAMSLRKNHVAEMSNMPLEDELIQEPKNQN